MEALLSAEDRVGMWLCGPTFSSADAALACLLFSLETLGLDGRLWKGGRRPNLAVYQVKLIDECISTVLIMGMYGKDCIYIDYYYI